MLPASRRLAAAAAAIKSDELVGLGNTGGAILAVKAAMLTEPAEPEAAVLVDFDAAVLSEPTTTEVAVFPVLDTNEGSVLNWTGIAEATLLSKTDTAVLA